MGVIKIKIEERKSNFEILRIIAILLIISFHYVFKRGYGFYTLTFNTFIIKSFYFFGELGVNLFILITGYFMITDKPTFKRVALLVIETFFYNLLNVLLDYHFSGTPITPLNILFPIVLNRYWFVTSYIILYIISPYLNIIVKNLKKIEHKRLLLILIILWSIIPTIFGLTSGNTESIMVNGIADSILSYTRLVWLIILYFIGSYIRLYGINFFKKKRTTIIVASITYLLMLLSIPFIYFFRSFFERIGTTEWAYLWGPNNIFMLVLSVCIFHLFSKLEVKPIKIINILASTTLGIYMLHDGLFNHYLWNEVFNNKVRLESSFAILYILGSTILIFIVGAIIDLIRQKIEKHTIVKLLNNKRINKFFITIKNTI